MVQLTPSKWHVAEQYRAIWEQRMGAVDRIRLQKEIDLDTREAPAILSHNRHVAKIPTANLSERRARLNRSPVDPDSRSWLSGAPALGNKQTQFTMQFNVLAALMLVVAASAVLEANALPIANILPVKPVLSKLYVASAANATIGRPGVPTSQKQMAKAVGW
ncbi:hypothetical protein PCASD_25729 [Puccinia coronata f. sp. avenae]|uniref:Uncharacterized protein n=1 Tax=Puccinia coronata f. sp. avenae TaxID=200324 RepID=A0A2N5S138_9BASI|nr:hypothetical protein PCASD_25729 [Puccinia coronata f. sp. avenae]